jgi:hypothetical protein
MALTWASRLAHAFANQIGKRGLYPTIRTDEPPEFTGADSLG